MAMEALGQPQQSYGEVQQFQQSMDPNMGSVSGGLEPQNNNLIVNYIPNNLTEVDLRNLFTPYGQVVHCKLVMDKVTGTSAGYGFVKFSDDESAGKSIAALNGFQLNGKTLKVSIARPMHQKNERTTLYVAGIPVSWSKTEFEALFAPYGPVTESKILIDQVGMSRGVGFITFNSSTAAEQALILNGTQPPGCEKPIQVKIKLPHSAAGAVPQFGQNTMGGGAGKMGMQQQQKAQMNMMFGMGAPMIGMPGGLAKPYGKAESAGAFSVDSSPYARPGDSSQQMMANPYEPFNMQMYAASMAAAMPQLQMNPFGAPAAGSPMDPYGLGALGAQAAAFGAPAAGTPLDPYGLGAMGALGAAGVNPYAAVAQPNPAAYGAAAAVAAGVASGQGQLPGVCLFVYHIPANASDDQLAGLFSPYGMVTGVKIIRDLATGASKGYGFVNFATLEQATLALNALQNYAWDGKRLRISFKTDRNKGGLQGGQQQQQQQQVQQVAVQGVAQQ